MKFLRSISIAAWALLFPLSQAWAEVHEAAGHGEEHEVPWKALSYAAINFIILMLILIYVLRKPLKEFFASRSTLIVKNIQESQELRQNAQQKLQEYENKLKNIETEMAHLVQSLEKEGELERQKLVDLADQQIANMKSTQTQIITQEVRKAKEELKREAIDLAEELAQKLIQKSFTPDDQKRLVQQYLEKMEQIS